MKLLDYLKKEWVIPDLKGRDKNGVLRELGGVMAAGIPGVTAEDLFLVLLEREKLGSTGIGEGIAVPHGRLKRWRDFSISFGRSRDGVEFDAIDGRPAHLFFLVMAPENSAVDNLKLLSRIVMLLKDSSFKKRLLRADSLDELYETIAEEDEKY
jgi:PTS system nitrogen regulatory IIA component